MNCHILRKSLGHLSDIFGSSLCYSYIVTIDSSTENPYKLPPILLKRFNQFAKIDDNTKKFQRIIELGKKLPTLADELRTEDNQVKGCTSLTYICGAKQEDGSMSFEGDSNSHLVKGLLALLIEGINGQKAEDIVQIDPAFIEGIGLSQTLTASRANGFVNTYHMVKNIAYNYLGS